MQHFLLFGFRGRRRLQLVHTLSLRPFPPGSSILHCQIRNNLELWGSVTELPGFENKVIKTAKEAVKVVTDKPKSLDDLIKKGNFVKPYADDVRKKGVEATAEGWLDSLRLKNLKAQFKQIIGLTVGAGRVISPQAFQTIGRQRYDKPKVIVEDARGSIDVGIANFFERDSADFSGVVQKIGNDGVMRLLTARDMLEIFIALHLEFVMNAATKITVVGMPPRRVRSGHCQTESLTLTICNCPRNGPTRYTMRCWTQ